MQAIFMKPPDCCTFSQVSPALWSSNPLEFAVVAFWRGVGGDMQTLAAPHGAWTCSEWAKSDATGVSSGAFPSEAFVGLREEPNRT